MDINNIPPLNITVKKAVSNGQVYELLTYEEYCENPKRYLGRSDVGISFDYKDGQQVVIPLRDEYVENPVSPGVYNAGVIDFIHMPDDSIAQKYIPDKIVSISNLDDVQNLIKSGEEIKKLDEPFITTPDEITQIPINIDDQPEMKALKMALNEKNMDLDKYSGRFGVNFPNDKRQLKNNSVTLNILKRFCANMDMEAVLTLKDKNPDVPNPIGREISVSLTDEFVDE